MTASAGKGRARLRWPLIAIWLAAAIPTAIYTQRLVEYFVMPDELDYVKNAVSIGHRAFLVLPGHPDFSSWSQLQSVLMAPFWTLQSTTTAFDVTHAVNAFVLSSACIPVYLLARRVLGSAGAAYAVAALSVAVPWLAMAGSEMTEVAAYPAFAWALLAFQRCVTDPGPRADLLALGAIVAMVFARNQLVFAAPALPLAVLLVELRFGGRAGVTRRAGPGARLIGLVRRHLVLSAVGAAAIGAILLLRATGHEGSVLGAYQTVTSRSLIPPGTWTESRELLAYIVVAVGVVPLMLALAWAVLTLASPARVEQHAFAAIAVPAGVLLTVFSGAYSANFSSGITDRYLMFLVPILVLGAAAFLLERRSAAPALTAGTLGAAWLLHGTVIGQAGASVVSPSTAWHAVVNGRVASVRSLLGLHHLAPGDALAWATLVAGAALVALRRWRRLDRGRVAVALGLVAVAYGVVETAYTLRKITATQSGASAAFIAGRNWIDRAVPSGARVAMLLSGAGDPDTVPGIWWDADFWNKAVDYPYALPGTPDLASAFLRTAAVDPRTGAVSGLSGYRYVLQSPADARLGLQGARTVRRMNGLSLLEVPTPLHASWTLEAADAVGTLSRRPARLRVYGAGGARMRVTLGLAAAAPGRWRITGAVRPLDLGGARTARGVVVVPIASTGFADVLIRALNRPAAAGTVSVSSAVRA